MLALAKSHAGALLLNGAPEGYPLGHPVDGVQQIPCLTSVTGVQAPDALCAFNDRGRTADPRPTGLHFFRNDEALPPWQCARAAVMACMAGVVWQAHGLTVAAMLH